MIRIGCTDCGAVFMMPAGAKVGEMSAWMRWHASDDEGARHELRIHPPSDKVAGESREVTHADLRDAMVRSRDYDEGARDAAQYVTGCLDHVTYGTMAPVTPRERGADAMLAGVRWYIAQQLAKQTRGAVAREVSPDAETVREQADALDIGKPASSDDDTAPLEVESLCGICGATHERCECAKRGRR